jgi:hypothetical protein
MASAFLSWSIREDNVRNRVFISLVAHDRPCQKVIGAVGAHPQWVLRSRRRLTFCEWDDTIQTYLVDYQIACRSSGLANRQHNVIMVSRFEEAKLILKRVVLSRSTVCLAPKHVRGMMAHIAIVRISAMLNAINDCVHSGASTIDVLRFFSNYWSPPTRCKVEHKRRTIWKSFMEKWVHWNPVAIN